MELTSNENENCVVTRTIHVLGISYKDEEIQIVLRK